MALRPLHLTFRNSGWPAGSVEGMGRGASSPSPSAASSPSASLALVALVVGASSWHGKGAKGVVGGQAGRRVFYKPGGLTACLPGTSRARPPSARGPPRGWRRAATTSGSIGMQFSCASEPGPMRFACSRPPFAAPHAQELQRCCAGRPSGSRHAPRGAIISLRYRPLSFLLSTSAPSPDARSPFFGSAHDRGGLRPCRQCGICNLFFSTSVANNNRGEIRDPGRVLARDPGRPQKSWHCLLLCHLSPQTAATRTCTIITDRPLLSKGGAVQQ